MTFAEMCQKASQRGIIIDERKLEQFKKYLSLLQEWNEKINLTAITDEAAIIEKHFYDCLLVAEFINFSSGTLLDLGSGAGFPGIPLKIIFPDLSVVLLEPTTKRANFLNLVIEELGLNKITAINKRAEEYAVMHREKFLYVTARAVARLNILLELAIPLLVVDGRFIAMKGAKGTEELSEAKTAFAILNCAIESVHEERLFQDNDYRQNIVIAKKAPTPSKYPRLYQAIKGKPL